jgi:hypothetical protein
MQAPKTNLKRERQVADILKAIKAYDLTSSSAWSALDVLSSHTFLDGVEVDPDGIIVKGKDFRGPISVYVVLKYSEPNEDKFETSDSFMGEFDGHFDEQEKPVIDHVIVDTSPFFEGEQA